MHAWEAIQSSLDYIEEHIREDIKTQSLAEMAGLSPFYFQRLFKRLTNKPVQEYIKLRKLCRVIEKLDENRQRTIDIALDYGFSSHANFTRAFKEAYGISPEAYKRTKPLLNTFSKTDLYPEHSITDEGAPLLAGKIVLEIRRETLPEPEIYLGLSSEIDIASQIPVGESTGIDAPGQLWRRFHAEKGTISHYLKPDAELGMSYSANPEKGTFLYFAGGRCKKLPDRVLDKFVLQELPAGDYLVCRVEAESFQDLVTTTLDQAGKYLFGTWLPARKLSTQPFSAEKYEKDAENVNYLELWVIPEPPAL